MSSKSYCLHGVSSAYKDQYNVEQNRLVERTQTTTTTTTTQQPKQQLPNLIFLKIPHSTPRVVERERLIKFSPHFRALFGTAPCPEETTVPLSTDAIDLLITYIHCPGALYTQNIQHLEELRSYAKRTLEHEKLETDSQRKIIRLLIEDAQDKQFSLEAVAPFFGTFVTSYLRKREIGVDFDPKGPFILSVADYCRVFQNEASQVLHALSCNVKVAIDTDDFSPLLSVPECFRVRVPALYANYNQKNIDTIPEIFPNAHIPFREDTMLLLNQNFYSPSEVADLNINRYKHDPLGLNIYCCCILNSEKASEIIDVLSQVRDIIPILRSCCGKNFFCTKSVLACILLKKFTFENLLEVKNLLEEAKNHGPLIKHVILSLFIIYGCGPTRDIQSASSLIKTALTYSSEDPTYRKLHAEILQKRVTQVGANTLLK